LLGRASRRVLGGEAVSAFIGSVLEFRGWEDGILPKVVFDFPDEHDLSGWVDNEQVIHLHEPV
jgi:hypothetical protein